MNGGKVSGRFGWRGLIASACLLLLLSINSVVGLERGLVTGNHVDGVMIALQNGDPAPDTWGAACHFASITKPGLAETQPLRCPVQAETPIRLRFKDETALPARTAGTPFRPPRTA
ncbi:hypothetical protein [Terrihabitans sp. B22-R8]|uniref:hypothetical protein n=1 Tax=Terrihabitans sp. B22-R8 TaxID=3425128 RepID=UPI00403D132F